MDSEECQIMTWITKHTQELYPEQKSGAAKLYLLCLNSMHWFTFARGSLNRVCTKVTQSEIKEQAAGMDAETTNSLSHQQNTP